LDTLQVINLRRRSAARIAVTKGCSPSEPRFSEDLWQASSERYLELKTDVP